MSASGSSDVLRHAVYIADIGIMLGSKVKTYLKGNECDLLTEVASILTDTKGTYFQDCKSYINWFFSIWFSEHDEPPLKKLRIEFGCSAEDSYDVPVIVQPSVEFFG